MVERLLLRASAGVRRHRAIRQVWWTAKRLGFGDRIRSLNTTRAEPAAVFDPKERRSLLQEFEPDIAAVEALVQRKLPEWRV